MNDYPRHLPLLPEQHKALAHVRALAARAATAARKDICAVLRRTGLDENIYDEAVRALASRARIALHFHPDRLGRRGITVAAGLLRDGGYKNQYETGLSSGSPSAFAGGERDRWENQLFGGAYHQAAGPAATRPKYGALQVMDHPDGPAPRFGSCYLLLRPEVARRASFTFGDSHEPQAPGRTGTLDTFDAVMAPLLLQIERSGQAFGVSDLNVPGVLVQLARGATQPSVHGLANPLGGVLDSYIEAQVHGEIRLCEDAEWLVADPAFRNHPVGETLAEACARHDIALCWHPGFTLPVEDVPSVFRGYPVRPLAERIAGRGTLDAAKIGAAANSLHLEPETWNSWATPQDTLTQFRRLWHVLVANGVPASTAAATPNAPNRAQ